MLSTGISSAFLAHLFAHCGVPRKCFTWVARHPMPIAIDLSLSLAWRLTRETTNSIHIYPVHFLVGVAHQWITSTKGNRTRHSVGAGLSGVVRCGSRVKWCGPVWEPG